MHHLAIRPLCQAAENRARDCARIWALPLYEELSASGQAAIQLLVEVDEQQLYLRLQTASPGSRLGLDWTSGRLGYRRRHSSSQSELLVRATGVKGRQAFSLVDATAGLGSDSLILATAGFRVTALERHPVLAAVLAEAVERARLAGWEAQLQVWCTDACNWLATTPEAPDIVYLDPMFPERSKSAQVKLPAQLLQVLHQGSVDQDADLLSVALQRARYRVIVKRPLHAPPLTDRKPDSQLRGKAVRFDIYALRAIPKGITEVV